MEKKLDNPIIVKNQDGLFQLLDDKNHTLETKAA
ncbi:helicase SNF2, partial [Lactobacillus paragasseri]|nr:helicase SNF2 [Lactobacillus paragasseri]